jgi:thioredoxin 1
MLFPVVEEVMGAYAGQAVFVKVNIDLSPNIATQYGISSLPTTFIFKGGVMVETSNSLMTRAKLAALIAKYL